MPDNDLKFDWVNLPAEAEELSLWPCLHDGQLLSVRSDSLKRTLTLEIDVFHLREHHQWSDETRVIFQFSDVESVRISAWSMWLVPDPESQNKPRVEQSRLIAEHQHKWREESLGWNSFESAFGTDSLDISAAFTVQTEITFALQIRGFMDGDVFDDQFVTVFMCAATCLVSLSDGRALSVEQLLAFGEEYWDNFGNRSSAKGMSN